MRTLPIREFNTLPRSADYLEEKSAHWLAGKIKAYWSRRSKAVDLQVVPVFASASPTDNAAAVYCIRSNMVGGRPV